MKYQGVIFDMDGVLLDATEWHYEALNEALDPFGFAISREQHLKRFDGLSTKKKLEILSKEFNLPYELHEIISETKQDRTLRIAAKKCYPNVSHLILLSQLKSLGLKIGLCTNSIRETTEQMLKYAHLFDLIDVIVTNQDVATPKPAPEGYLLTCSKLGFSPDQVLVVEDGDYGVEAAKAAGCDVLRVKNPFEVTIETLGTRIVELR
jgi:HAD superfamily hydrolase (TIGR01509 family)